MIKPEQEAEVRGQVDRLPPFFRSLIRKALDAAHPRLPLDPARFEDPVALRTEWTPLKRGGANFRARRLRQESIHRMAFVASPAAWAVTLAFLLSGLADLVLLPLLVLPALTDLPPLIRTLLPLSGLPFLGAGIWLAYVFLRPVIFDKERAWFWKGYRPPELVSGAYTPREGMPLSRVHALQILVKVVHSHQNTYTCWELNLVGRDGSRLHLVQSGQYPKLREEADRLASFLGAAVWDAAG